MESSRSSNISFYDLHDQPGTPISAPVEGRNCGIAIHVPKEVRHHISLRLGSEFLPVLESDEIAYSEWPQCGPGYHELVLECDTIVERRIVTIMPRYFSVNDMAALIHDLTEVVPNAIASRLNACGAQLAVSPLHEKRSPLEVEYFRLRRAILGTKETIGMMQILRILQRTCHQVLKPKLELRSVNKVRRPDISKLPLAMIIPGNVLSETKVYQMFDTTVDSSFDAYENRLVKAYVLALRSRLSRLQAALHSTPAPPAMAAELELLINEFHLAYMRANFLRGVKDSALSSIRVTMILLKNASYRAVLEGYLALNERPSVRLEEPALSFPLNNFPYLYQRWANLKLLSAMLQVGAESGFRCVSHHWVKSYVKKTNIHVMNDALPAVQLVNEVTGRSVSFVPWSATSATTNIAGQQSPVGAAITIVTPGRPIVFLLFDPKYWVDSKSKKTDKKTRAKSSAAENEFQKLLSTVEPLKQDVDEIVRLRDQLRASNGMSEIKFSAILYPGLSKKIAPDIVSISAHPSSTDEFHKNICDVLRRYLA